MKENKVETTTYAMLLADYELAIVGWHHDRNLIEGSTDLKQISKMREEVDELEEDSTLGKDILDEAGDVLVTVINVLERNGYTLLGALKGAHDKIKDRKGKMIDGIFVKAEDL